MNERTRGKVRTLLITVALVIAALILGGVLVLLSGNDPLTAYKAILDGAFGSSRKITELFVKLIPILILALGVSIAYKSQLWNIGASGQFIMGSVTAAAVAIYVNVPFFLRIPLSFVCAMAAGALYAGFAGWLKNRFNANEVITTLMLNYIAEDFLMYLINGPMQDPYSDLSQSDIIPDEMRLLRFVGNNSRLHTGLFIMIAVVILVYLLWKTSLGYRITLVGQGERVAAYAGVKVERTVVITMLLSGALCGIAGWIELFGINYRILDGIAADYGDIATIVALLGSLQVPGIVAAGAFFSVLLCGGASMQRMTEVPYSVVNVMEGLIIILIITKDRINAFFMQRKNRKIFGKEKRHAE